MAETAETARIAKVLARAGVASRRDAEAMIAAGRVAVNGRAIESPALTVGPADRITVDGRPLPAPEPMRLWLYHKPAGLVTTARDEEGRATVFEHLPEGLPRVMPVGRLDITSEGLLLLTNDGELKRRLELPSTGWLRRYRVRVHGAPEEATLEPLRQGIVVEGEAFQPMEVRLDRQQGTNAWLTVGLREGRNREVRRAMEAVGLVVTRLIRVSYGPFQLGGLAAGEVAEVAGRVLRAQLGLPEAGEDAGGTDRPAQGARGGAAGAAASRGGAGIRAADDRKGPGGRGAGGAGRGAGGAGRGAGGGGRGAGGAGSGSGAGGRGAGGGGRGPKGAGTGPGGPKASRAGQTRAGGPRSEGAAAGAGPGSRGPRPGGAGPEGRGEAGGKARWREAGRGEAGRGEAGAGGSAGGQRVPRPDTGKPRGAGPGKSRGDGPGRSGPERAQAGRAGPGRGGPERGGPERGGASRGGPERRGPGRGVPDRGGPGRDEPDRGGPRGGGEGRAGGRTQGPRSAGYRSHRPGGERDGPGAGGGAERAAGPGAKRGQRPPRAAGTRSHAEAPATGRRPAPVLGPGTAADHPSRGADGAAGKTSAAKPGREGAASRPAGSGAAARPGPRSDAAGAAQRAGSASYFRPPRPVLPARGSSGDTGGNRAADPSQRLSDRPRAGRGKPRPPAGSGPKKPPRRP